MSFNAPFNEFDFHFVQRDPDIVEADFDIYYKDNKSDITWFCPAGDKGRSDGQSVPRLLWFWVGPPLEGTAIRAAFLHDYNYRIGKYSKAEIDLMFYHALLEDEDDHAYLKYLGVKWFGFRAWNRYRKNESKPTNL